MCTNTSPSNETKVFFFIIRKTLCYVSADVRICNRRILTFSSLTAPRRYTWGSERRRRLDRTARTLPCHLCACISAAVTRLHSGWQVRTRGFTADEALGIKQPLYRDVTALSAAAVSSRYNSGGFERRMEPNERLNVPPTKEPTHRPTHLHTNTAALGWSLSNLLDRNRNAMVFQSLTDSKAWTSTSAWLPNLLLGPVLGLGVGGNPTDPSAGPQSPTSWNHSSPRRWESLILSCLTSSRPSQPNSVRFDLFVCGAMSSMATQWCWTLLTTCY